MAIFTNNRYTQTFGCGYIHHHWGYGHVYDHWAEGILTNIGDMAI
jgi:hypothetical protein